MARWRSEIAMNAGKEELLASQDSYASEEKDDSDGQAGDAAQTGEGEPVATDDTQVQIEEAPATEKPSPPPEAKWYVIHSYSGYENKVRRNLEQRIETMAMHSRIFRVVVPTEEEVEIRGGQRRTVRKRVFPGYIFVQMVMDDDSWYVVRNTPAVTGFVGSGARPTPISDEEVEKILRRMETEQPRIRVSFREGETVRITQGPFADFMAVVDELYPERGKIRLLVSFFGRETPVEMDFLQVESI